MEGAELGNALGTIVTGASVGRSVRNTLGAAVCWMVGTTVGWSLNVGIALRSTVGAAVSASVGARVDVSAARECTMLHSSNKAVDPLSSLSARRPASST